MLRGIRQGQRADFGNPLHGSEALLRNISHAELFAAAVDAEFPLPLIGAPCCLYRGPGRVSWQWRSGRRGEAAWPGRQPLAHLRGLRPKPLDALRARAEGHLDGPLDLLRHVSPELSPTPAVGLCNLDALEVQPPPSMNTTTRLPSPSARSWERLTLESF